MRDQVEQVHALYRELANDPEWFARYRRDPEALLDHHQIKPQNREMLRCILALYCRAELRDV